MLRLVARFRSLPGVVQRLCVAASVAAMIYGSAAMRPDPLEVATTESVVILDAQRIALEKWKAIRQESEERWEIAEADRVEREVLPVWRRGRERIEKVMAGPEGRYMPPDLAELFRLREESWVALVQAVREDDEELFRRHVELWGKADDAAKRVSEFNGETPEFAKGFPKQYQLPTPPH